ncbi:hypothetical protein ABK040_004155 [Willaertia magna]
MSATNNFLSESNLCGQTLLHIVSRGNAIIAELLRLSHHIPSVYYLNDNNNKINNKYNSIIFDFKYLKNQDQYDNRITTSSELLDLDESFKESHMPILERFYTLFKSIYNYYKDIIRFVNDLEQQLYIQQSIESILVNQDGKQLLAELIYLYGVMLLLLDYKIPGIIRERMLMSYYRYKGAGEIPNIDDICKLCRSTGYETNSTNSNNNIQNYPLNYPCEYFNRFPLPEMIINMIIGRLRSDDIYLQTSYYPLPEHRSVALSTQASMLFIILYFKYNILNDEYAIMREIVDKHFNDNWVISYYMGFTIDLTFVWKDFKAASLAINNIVQLNHVKYLCDLHSKNNLPKLLNQLNQYLTEGVLIEEYILDNINKLVSCLRDCNVTLRWLLLHRTTNSPIKKIKELILENTNQEEILLLLLNISQFEFLLKNKFQEMLDEKEMKWNECKNKAKNRMNELANYFSGEKALTPEELKDEQLQQWFLEMSNKINDIDYHDSTLAGRKIHQVTLALEDVEQFHQIEQSLQVKQYLSDTRLLLKKMIRYVNIKQSILIGIAICSDISYAWEIIIEYVNAMQLRIKKDPSLIIKIRSTFLKLATMLELPLVRIIQSKKSNDIVSVSQYYSSELVKFVRNTLEIIPISMFDILNKIIELQTNKIKELPSKLNRNDLKIYSQLDERYELARCTFEVSKYTEGILAMEKTLMGIVEIDPKQLLEDGIRKELVRKITFALNNYLNFISSNLDFNLTDLLFLHKKLDNINLLELNKQFENKLLSLNDLLDGMLRSFEYIQDYVHVYGLKLWQEEYARIIMYHVEQEANQFLKKKIYDFQSLYQSHVIPIPKIGNTNNFMGRLLIELFILSDSRRTVYIEPKNGWYDINNLNDNILGLYLFSKLYSTIGTYGLVGLDLLISFRIVHLLNLFIKNYIKFISKKQVKIFEEYLFPPNSLPDLNLMKLFDQLNLPFLNFIQFIMSIGTCQLLRRELANQLLFSCKLNANPLYHALQNVNDAIQKDFIFKNNLNLKNNPILSELTNYLSTTGLHSPFDKIYLTPQYVTNHFNNTNNTSNTSNNNTFHFNEYNDIQHVGLVCFLFLLHVMDKFIYNSSIDCLISKKKGDILDGTPFIIGILTILKQFHISQLNLFISYIGQFIRSNLDQLELNSGKKNINDNCLFMLRFLQQFSKYGNVSQSILDQHVPPFLFANMN